MKGFRNKMAESIVKQGDKLCGIEKNGDVQMWLIYDHDGERAPQYQVWHGDKRCYVGPNRDAAYADYRKQVGEFIADWALI